VEIHDIILSRLAPNPRGNGGGKFQILEPRRPACRRQNIVEKPAVHVMAKSFKLFGVVEHHTRCARLALSTHPNGVQNLQQARSLYRQKGTSFISSK